MTVKFDWNDGALALLHPLAREKHPPILPSGCFLLSGFCRWAGLKLRSYSLSWRRLESKTALDGPAV